MISKGEGGILFPTEKHLPPLSKRIRGEGQNADKLPTTLSKEPEQRLRVTDRGKCMKSTSSERSEVYQVPQA